MNESHTPEKTAEVHPPSALPQTDAFQANEAVHWPTLTKTLVYTGLALTMIGGRFLAPHEVFEEAGLMIMGAGMALFIIGLWRGKIAPEEPESVPPDEPEKLPDGR